MSESCRANTRAVSVMKKCDDADVTNTHTHTPTRSELRAPAHLIDTATKSEISQSPQSSPVQTHTHTLLVYVQICLRGQHHIHFHVYIMWLVVTVLETFLLSKHNRVLTLPTISVRLCVCVADGTHVWSMVAGWLEPEVGGGLHLGQSGEEGGV